jgi:predicted amino acid dehydrogenase
VTRRIEQGYGVRRTALNMADTCVKNAKLIAVAVDETLDNDPDNITMLRTLNELSRNNMAAFAVLGKVADGNLAEAELLSEGMNDAPKAALQKGVQRGAQKAVNGVKRSTQP